MMRDILAKLTQLSESDKNLLQESVEEGMSYYKQQEVDKERVGKMNKKLADAPKKPWNKDGVDTRSKDEIFGRKKTSEAVGTNSANWLLQANELYGDSIAKEMFAWMGGYERDEFAQHIARHYELGGQIDAYDLLDMLDLETLTNELVRYHSEDELAQFVDHFKRHYDLDDDVEEAIADEPASPDAKKVMFRKKIEQHQSRSKDDWWDDEDKPKVKRFKGKYGSSYDAGEEDLDEACSSKKKMKEGNKFSGEMAKAKAAGAKEFEVDGKKYKVSEGKAKPDFMDLDKDGDTEESMKKASKEAKMKQTVSESVQLDECGMDEGNVNVSGSPDALIALMKLAGMQQPVASAFQPEAPAPAAGSEVNEAPEDYPNVVSTKPGDGDYEKGFMYFDKVTGELYKTHPGHKVLSPDEFMAGRGEVKSGGDFAHMSDEELQDAINDAMEQGDSGAAEEYYAELEKRSMGESSDEEEMDEAYANEPEEEYSDVDAVIPSGNDLHRAKKSFPATAGGDNPMGLDEDLWAAYEAMRDEVK